MERTWRYHIRATLALGLPLIASQLATMGLGVTDTLMLGWLSAEALAAGVLAGSLYFVLLITGTGFSHAMTPLIAAGLGASDPVTARRAVRMGFWVVMGFGLLCLPILLLGKEIFLALGQDAELAELAGRYLLIAGPSILPNLAQMLLRNVYSAVERAGIILVVSIGALFLNAALNWALIFGNWGAPALGIDGAALATLMTNIAICGFLFAYLSRLEETRTLRLFDRIWRADWPMFRRILSLGWPVSLALLAEAAMFSMGSIMIGWLGVQELAAHGIALQIITFSFMIPLGLALAASVRVGRAHGAGDQVALFRASATALLMGLAISMMTGAALLLIPATLLSPFLSADDPVRDNVIAYGVLLLAVAAIFQITDALQVLLGSLLRGVQDTRIPGLIGVFCYLGIGIPAGYILCFPLGWGGPGVWAGLAIGLTCATIAYALRFRRHISGSEPVSA